MHFKHHLSWFKTDLIRLKMSGQRAIDFIPRTTDFCAWIWSKLRFNLTVQGCTVMPETRIFTKCEILKKSRIDAPRLRFNKTRWMIANHVAIPLFEMILKVFKGVLVFSTDSQGVINHVVNYCTSSILQSQDRWKHTIMIQWIWYEISYAF